MAERIVDPSDARLADYACVGDPVWLKANGLFVAEGRFVVERLLASEGYAVRSICLTPAALRAMARIPPPIPTFVADQSLLNGITGFDFHRGCLAIAERPAERGLESFAGATRLVALEGVGNPDNVGGLFRVAAAFGVEGVLLDPATGDPFYRKAIRTSMGSVLSTPFARVDPWPEGLRPLRDAGFGLVALTPRADAEPLDDFAARAPGRFVVMVGAEGPGLGNAALDFADARVRIPIAPGVDSLNVTVAAGIALSRLAPM